ncbi:MAG: hypothetical protein MUO26_12560 [Methanotrichaceae archaeon]|nr:hypothetical protein [Methanotrichaceae archaeon]
MDVEFYRKLEMINQLIFQIGLSDLPSVSCPLKDEMCFYKGHCQYYFGDDECGIWFCELNATGGCVDLVINYDTILFNGTTDCGTGDRHRSMAHQFPD